MLDDVCKKATELKEVMGAEQKALSADIKSSSATVSTFLKSAGLNEYTLNVTEAGSGQRLQYYIRNKESKKKTPLTADAIAETVRSAVVQSAVRTSSTSMESILNPDVNKGIRNDVCAALLAAFEQAEVKVTNRLTLDRGRPGATTAPPATKGDDDDCSDDDECSE